MDPDRRPGRAGQLLIRFVVWTLGSDRNTDIVCAAVCAAVCAVTALLVALW